MRAILSLAILISLCFSVTEPTLAAEHIADVVIYGGTSAAVMAAVQVKKMGHTVLIVSPDKHLGGLSSGGLGWTDSGNKAVIGGLSREFYGRVKGEYDKDQTWKFEEPEDYKRYDPKADAIWAFEPHLAEKVFNDYIAEYEIPVFYERLDRDRKLPIANGNITGLITEAGNNYRGKVYLDCTYEGDLLEEAGVTFTVGREANSKYNETLNGVQIKNATKHQFTHDISAYVVPGDPSSGLLPRVHDGDPGEDGEADHRLQAYNYRVCLTQVPENRMPFPKPEGYDPLQYELLLRDLQAGSRHVFGKFDMLPNKKTDTNNHGSFSTDNIGMNYDYPTASYARRAEILKEHETYQKGYFYFLCNDPRVPEDVRTKMSRWGLARDEFLDNGHWPHQIYVREARRLVSDFVMNERHLRALEPTPESIGMGSYNMDSHNVQRYVDENGFVRNEGDVQKSPGGPYPISYRAIVPKEEECANLLVPVCLSSSHIAYGSIRMEPVFMILGQSAATAAVLAIENQTSVQDVKYEQLRERLLEDGQVLEYARKAFTGGRGVDPKKLKGIVIDDVEAKKIGPWFTSTSTGTFVGDHYLHDGAEPAFEKSVIFTATIPKSGKYEVRIAYTPNPNRGTNVPVTVGWGNDQSKSFTVNMKKAPSKDGSLHKLGDFEFGEGETVSVTISNKEANGYVIADAVQLLLE